MVALDFPDTPTVGQVYERWTWNGTVWVLTADAVTPWANVTFQNAWVGAPGVDYTKVGEFVYLRGLMAGGASGTVAFTLPAGFRPPGAHNQIGPMYAGGPSFCYFDVAVSGAVTPIFTGAMNAIGVPWSFSTRV